MNSGWKHFVEHFITVPELKLTLDFSKVYCPEDQGQWKNERLFDLAAAELRAIESGEPVNSDENRMVGHYWLRNPELAPDKEIQTQISTSIATIEAFAADINSGRTTVSGSRVQSILLIGIGGSALGPMLLADIYRDRTRLPLFILDNTDPDGIQKILNEIPSLAHTLVIVTSKSGGTRETRNGMLLTEACFSRSGLKFENHAVAITGEGSALDNHASEKKWLARFPIWDWVGGRTSLWSAVGLLPAALQGIDIRNLLAGAAALDSATRTSELDNPALRMAHSWYHLGNGHGERMMVVLPYRDRLVLLARYLQQLVMESIGKRYDRSGKEVFQGLTVFGNKGSTDQHSYIQQLREGPDNFFAVFVDVLKDVEEWSKSKDTSLPVENGVSAGDYLEGFLLGTRAALADAGKGSITLSLPDCSEKSIGALIALFERAVGAYAAMIDINAYHQPGVEAGKKAAEEVIESLQKLRSSSNSFRDPISLNDLVTSLNDPGISKELVFKLLQRMEANGEVLSERAETLDGWKYNFCRK